MKVIGSFVNGHMLAEFAPYRLEAIQGTGVVRSYESEELRQIAGLLDRGHY